MSFDREIFDQMLAFLCLSRRKFTYTSWYVGNVEREPSMRTICAGWNCGADKNEIDFMDQLNENITLYKNGSLKTPILESINPLIEHNFGPAFCAAGSFYLFGGENIQTDEKKGLDLIKKGADMNAWPCMEILAFIPPFSSKEYLEKASEMGSAIAKTVLAKTLYNQKEYRKALLELRHLTTASAVSWNRRHRAGHSFANAIRQITLKQNFSQPYEELLILARNNNLPATLWLADGIITGRTSIISDKEICELLMDLQSQAPWRFPSDLIASSKERLNKENILNLYKNMGSELASAVLSYKSLIE